MAHGSATVDFGSAIPGHGDATVDVTGQTSIVAGSKCEAWVRVASSVDHSADEHAVESLEFAAGNIVAGVGFTIYAQIREGLASGVFNIDWVWTT